MTAVSLAPGCAGHWNTLALAHTRAGHWNQAIAALDRAGQIGASPSSFDHYLRVITRAHLGDHEGALAAFRLADSLRVRHHELGADLRTLRAEAVAALETSSRALADQKS